MTALSESLPCCFLCLLVHTLVAWEAKTTAGLMCITLQS